MTFTTKVSKIAGDFVESSSRYIDASLLSALTLVNLRKKRYLTGLTKELLAHHHFLLLLQHQYKSHYSSARI